MEFDAFVLAATLSDLGDEPRARGVADAVEFRMDLAETPLESLRAYDGELPVIATNRTELEGGEATPGDQRCRDLSTAARLPAVEAVDVELAVLDTDRGRRVRSAATEAGVATVVSSHDFEGTPDSAEMVRRLRRATDLGTVGKLAVTATDRRDVLELLSATDRIAEDRPVATMAMGEVGRHSRAVAPLYGSRIGYAPVDPAAATAPGQYDLGTLSHLLDSLSA